MYSFSEDAISIIKQQNPEDFTVDQILKLMEIELLQEIAIQLTRLAEQA